MNYLEPIQYILLIFLAFATSRVYLRTRDGSINFSSFIFWMGLFFVVGISVIDPSYTTYLANQLGAGRGVDIAAYISIVLLFYLIFRTNVMLENLRHDLTRLVRELALKEFEKEKTKKKITIEQSNN